MVRVLSHRRYIGSTIPSSRRTSYKVYKQTSESALPVRSNYSTRFLNKIRNLWLSSQRIPLKNFSVIKFWERRITNTVQHTEPSLIFSQLPGTCSHVRNARSCCKWIRVDISSAILNNGKSCALWAQLKYSGVSQIGLQMYEHRKQLLYGAL